MKHSNTLRNNNLITLITSDWISGKQKKRKNQPWRHNLCSKVCKSRFKKGLQKSVVQRNGARTERAKKTHGLLSHPLALYFFPKTKYAIHILCTSTFTFQLWFHISRELGKKFSFRAYRIQNRVQQHWTDQKRDAVYQNANKTIFPEGVLV